MVYEQKWLSVLVGTFFVILLLFPAGVFARSSISSASDTETMAQPVRTDLNPETIQKGFTIETSNQEIRLGVTPNALSKRKRVQVALKPVEASKKNKLGKKTKEVLLSNLFSFDLFNEDTVEVLQPIWITMKWHTSSEEEYVLKYWDADQQAWVEMPTTVNEEAQWIQAMMNIPFAVVGVFEKERINYRGYASWYNWHSAAMNDLPLGTDILVQNPSTGAEATTTVLSTGPFYSNRIIDLPRSVFEAIGNLSDGVMEVIITPLEKLK